MADLPIGSRTGAGGLLDPPPVPEPIEITNGSLTATISPLGATLRDLRMAGVEHPLVLGWGDESAYLDNGDYLGPLVGRCANRIAGGTYELSGNIHRLDRNFRDRHALHGGSDGIDKHVWTVETRGAAEVTLSLALADGHMGFGGALAIEARFRIADPACLRLDIRARSKGQTLCNIAPHWYFNLDGHGDIKTHRLQILADTYLPVDDDLIPTGDERSVADSAFDFRAPREIGSFPYDHNFCTSRRRQPERRIATLASATSGVCMELSSTEPGLQVYTGTHLHQPDRPTLAGVPYTSHSGIALEPQCWPDAPNNEGFPGIVLNEGELYRHSSSFSFSTRAGSRIPDRKWGTSPSGSPTGKPSHASRSHPGPRPPDDRGPSHGTAPGPRRTALHTPRGDACAPARAPSGREHRTPRSTESPHPGHTDARARGSNARRRHGRDPEGAPPSTGQGRRGLHLARLHRSRKPANPSGRPHPEPDGRYPCPKPDPSRPPGEESPADGSARDGNAPWPVAPGSPMRSQAPSLGGISRPLKRSDRNSARDPASPRQALDVSGLPHPGRTSPDDLVPHRQMSFDNRFSTNEGRPGLFPSATFVGVR